jgi:hypothetical protein
VASSTHIHITNYMCELEAYTLPLLRHSNGHNLESSGRFSVFFRDAWVMKWSRKSYTRSHWLSGTEYGTNRAHGHLLHLE